MSTIDDQIKQNEQEIADMNFAMQQAQEKGLTLADYDLQSVTKARTRDREKEEADLAAKLKQDMENVPKSIGPETASTGGGGGTTPQVNVTRNGQQVGTPVSSSPTPAPAQPNTFDLSNSKYTNIDPDAYLLTLAQMDKDVDTTDPKAMQKWFETVGKNKLMPGVRSTINFSEQREDPNWKVVEDININDAGVRDEVMNSPQWKIWWNQNKDKFKTMPEDFLVVQSKTETNNGKPVTYIRPNISEEWYNENAIYNVNNKNLYPNLERQKQIVEDNPDKSLEEIEKTWGSMERYRQWQKGRKTTKKD